MKRLITVALLLVGCGTAPKKEHEDVYDVPDSIQPYVDIFLDEGAARGHDIDLDNLIILIQPLSNISTAGNCRPGPTPLIKLNARRWEYYSETRKLAIVAHELGHCILNLDHSPAGSLDIMEAVLLSDYVLDDNMPLLWDKLFNEKG